VGFQFNNLIQNLSCQTFIYSLLLLFYNYFPVDLFEGSSDLAGTGSTLFSGGLFWRELKLNGNWLHIIFRQIVLEVAHFRHQKNFLSLKEIDPKTIRWKIM
jgi:hypothetical protein